MKESGRKPLFTKKPEKIDPDRIKLYQLMEER